MNENIKRLQEQIEFEKRRISNCTHEFGSAIYDPERVSEPYGYRSVRQGSDVWSEPTGYRDVEKKRWSRSCKKCGEVQYSYTQKPIISGYEPSF